MHRTLPAFQGPYVIGAALADGSNKELCVGCTEFIAARESPWILSNVPVSKPRVAPARTRIHATTGERRDVSDAVGFTLGAAFSSDGKQLCAPSMKGRVARNDVGSGAVEQLGSVTGLYDRRLRSRPTTMARP